MESITLERLAAAIGAVPPAGARQILIHGVSTDTRSLRPGEVFFALRGEQMDGVRFLEQAFARGARAAVVPCDAPDLGPRRLMLRVPDTRVALGALARDHRERMGFKVVAITGSAGKTTTKDLIYAMVSGCKSAVRAPKSFNNDVGVPLTLLAADPSTEVVVLEVGTSGPGEIERLARIAKPDLAVLTCIAPAHLEGLGSIEGVAQEKLSLLRHLDPRAGALIVNGEDLRLRAAAAAFAEVHGAGRVTRCTLGAGGDLEGEVAPDARGELQLTVRQGGRERVRLPLRVPGRPFAQDALLALAAAIRLGLTPEQAAAGLRAFKAPPGRMNLLELGGVTLIDDTYNANPASVGAALETFSGLTGAAGRVVVLGTMKELGRESAHHHRALGRSVAELGVARLVTVGEEAREVARGASEAGLAPERIHALSDAGQVAAVLLPHLTPGVAVLFKASRACRLEQAVADVRGQLRNRPRAA